MLFARVFEAGDSFLRTPRGVDGTLENTDLAAVGGSYDVVVLGAPVKGARPGTWLKLLTMGWGLFLRPLRRQKALPAGGLGPVLFSVLERLISARRAFFVRR
jgi:hypothetical protein